MAIWILRSLMSCRPDARQLSQDMFITGIMNKVYNFLKEKIKQGNQVYIVYPLIEESETLDLKNLTEGFQTIVREFPPPLYSVGMVHGKMKQQQKDAEMKRFLSRETQILVSTTVIEVGVDIPQASVMVIENAERFGLSQLHQLRGRVGRGAAQSYCLLVTNEKPVRMPVNASQLCCEPAMALK